jgi:inorganic pyrophosphatase
VFTLTLTRPADLESGKCVKVLGWGDAAEAKRMIAEAIARAGRAQ